MQNSKPDLTDALCAYLSARAHVPVLMQEVFEQAPEYSLAHAMQGYLLKLAAHPSLAEQLQTHSQKATAAAQTEQEQRHAQALQAWCDDDVDGAITHLEGLIAADNLDVLALRVAHYLHFYKGSGAAMHGSTQHAMDRWQLPDRLHGYLLGMHAFGLEEDGRYAEAESLARQALTINPDDLWSVHAVAHVLYSRREYDAGIAWLASHAGALEGANNFRYHLHWHAALFWLGLGEPDQALGIYDTQLEASLGDDFYLDMCNNASLLWRLERAGLEVGSRWQQLLPGAQAHVDDRELVFASLHYGLVLARMGHGAFDRFRENLAGWAAPSGGQAAVCETVGQQVGAALQQQFAKQQIGAVPDLADRTPDGGWNDATLRPMGGSRAQREVFLTLPVPASS
ncbi:MAG: hypothetical protein AAF529_10210 [Pseudomonadota bacterium]